MRRCAAGFTSRIKTLLLPLATGGLLRRNRFPGNLHTLMTLAHHGIKPILIGDAPARTRSMSACCSAELGAFWQCFSAAEKYRGVVSDFLRYHAGRRGGDKVASRTLYIFRRTGIDGPCHMRCLSMTKLVQLSPPHITRFYSWHSAPEPQRRWRGSGAQTGRRIAMKVRRPCLRSWACYPLRIAAGCHFSPGE